MGNFKNLKALFIFNLILNGCLTFDEGINNWEEKSQDIEWQYSAGGVAGVYNLNTQNVEWQYSAGGVDGVFIPKQ